MIHQTAIISKNAKIGKNVKIGPYSIVGDKVELADNVELKSHVIVEGNTYVGEGTVIFQFASIGSQTQDLKYEGEDSKVIIGKNNSIREYVTIQPGTKGGDSITEVGDNGLLMLGVHIAHDCKVGNNVIFANYVSLAGHVEVGDHAIIGGLSAVQQHIKVGSHSITGGVSALVKDLIPFGLAVADRAHLEGLTLVGMNRRGFDKSKSLEASKAVQYIFEEKSQGLFEDRVKDIANKHPDNEVIQTITNFLLRKDSKGFCKTRVS
jgi:UDP-N-acetylglucosamine acyltransferase